jgi:CheY-like chemotaxis protein
MPEMDGLTLANELHQLPGAGKMPLLLLTSLGIHSLGPHFSRAAFASCLTKPIKPARLLEVLLRVAPDCKLALGQPPVDTKPDPAPALRVLLCDDNVINQKVAIRLLQQLGFHADLATNGVEALAALDQQPYDLILMDVMMPEMGGFEATHIIRERQRQPAQFPNYKSPIIIIAMTASVMPGDREKCFAAGMDDYLAKPVRLDDIRGIMERWGARVAARAPAPVLAQPPAPPSEVSPDEAPVEIERLLDFSDGNPDSLRELVTLYIHQTGDQMRQLQSAVQAGSAADVRRLAHSAAGASATCGVRHLVPLLRKLEHQGLEGELTGATRLCQEAVGEFDRLRGFLEAYLAQHPPAPLAPDA